MNRVVIAFGSNLGEREQIIIAALAELGARAGRLVATSSLIETDALIHPTDRSTWHPPFLNGVVLLDSDLDPLDLLDCLLEIEQHFGRRRDREHQPWQPRTIDLDLIAYGDQIVRHERLVLPHPRMHERAFVLGPLAEVWPDWLHPVKRRTAKALLAAINESRSGQE